MAKAMVKTKEKANPYQDHIDSLRKKQNELLDAFQRDKQAGSNTDDGIQDLARDFLDGGVIHDADQCANTGSRFTAGITDCP